VLGYQEDWVLKGFGMAISIFEGINKNLLFLKQIYIMEKYKFISNSTKAKQPTYYQSFDKGVRKQDKLQNMSFDQNFVLPPLQSKTNIEDAKNLLTFYKFPNGQSNKTNETIYQEDVFKKFQITGKINSHLSRRVTQYLHNDSLHKVKPIETEIEETPEEENIKAEGKIKIFEYHYNNPLNVLENLKINKSIHDNIKYIVNDFTKNSFNKAGNSSMNRTHKQKIKIRTLEDTPILIKKLTEDIQHKNMLFKNKESRHEFLANNPDLVGKYFSQYIEYPCSRTQSSMVLYKDNNNQVCKIYLFAGLGIYKFSDLWVFDLSKINL
jgi:hypothetical protein